MKFMDVYVNINVYIYIRTGNVYTYVKSYWNTSIFMYMFAICLCLKSCTGKRLRNNVTALHHSSYIYEMT